MCFFCLSGFCVAMIMKSLLRLCVLLLMVMWCFCIVLSKVVCVFGGVWLILFVSNSLVKIGFCVSLNLLVEKLNRLVLSKLFGNRLGVNWMCLKVNEMSLVKVCVSSVFVVFGIFLKRMCFLVSREMSRSVMVFFWLMIMCLILVWMLLLICWSCSRFIDHCFVKVVGLACEHEQLLWLYVFFFDRYDHDCLCEFV